MVQLARRNLYLILFSITFILSGNLWAQNTATIKGKVIDEFGNAVESASISIAGLSGTSSDAKGNYQLKVPANQKVSIIISHLSFERKTFYAELESGSVREVNFVLNSANQIISIVEIESSRNEGTGTISIDPEGAKTIATAGDAVMGLIKSSGMGVASNNELSAGYMVRGGNFDENLIYVNDVEVYRPFLARSGQQEGLSFINGDMVEAINFSSGGFESRYGDKMSSVLDITYRKPTKFKANVSGGFLGAQAHIEDAIINKRLKYNIGGRYRSNNYLLSSMDTKGEYKPNFFDFQGSISFDVSEKLELNVLGIYSRNQFNVVPKDRETEFGTINEAYRFKVYFEGKEQTSFRTGMGAFTATYRPSDATTLKLIASITDTKESETFDVNGQYFLSQVDNNLGSDDFGKDKTAIGIGGYLNHARNSLQAKVYSVQHKGTHVIKNTTLRWGVQYQHENISDRVKEWNYMDSSGYFLPYHGPTDSFSIDLQKVVNSKINLNSDRFLGYYENSFNFFAKDSTKIILTIGARAQYWTMNKQFLFSPRLQFAVKPNWVKSVVFRVAGGIYYQAPFYREMRDPYGNVNTNVKAQRSIHAIVGFDYVFKMWRRPFKITTEAYYKYLDNLNPYQIDNVRIRYFANNSSKGYATGIDFKINGQFVKGLESWATLSVMSTKEDIANDDYYRRFDAKGQEIPQGVTGIPIADSTLVSPGLIARPTDQRVSFSIFFQDQIRNNPNFKVHLNLLLGTGFPFGPGNYKRYQDVFRMPFYRRVDIGFSCQILGLFKPEKTQKIRKYMKSAWLSAEVFNLLGLNNTVSYMWIKDNTGRQYSIPNYLTPRLINLRLIFDF